METAQWIVCLAGILAPFGLLVVICAWCRRFLRIAPKCDGVQPKGNVADDGMCDACSEQMLNEN